ncbi:MAG: hypothetical protein AUJ89_02650 [Candidatus Omnitrophica bacterium CG1_02_43_210]|nr:MAG: hypothetical protein AUJ89_02650 [Candidatus Omnitrophica bacterium CG1_02_43_210]
MRKIIPAILFSALILSNSHAFAAQSARVIGYNYHQNTTASNQIIFSTSIQNTGDAIAAPGYIYVQVILTSRGTGVGSYPGGATSTAVLAPGATFRSTTNWASVAGQYTITLVIYGSEDGITETELSREYGAFPVRVGANPTAEKLQIFPTMIDFGVIPYGRHMHPAPLEVKWDFFLYNVMHHQQPWYMRIYTDNTTRYRGIEDSVYKGSPAGLVSSDGKYTLPIKTWCLNYPPDDQEMGWDTVMSGPPTVDDDTYWIGPYLDSGERYENKAAWIRIPDYNEMTSDRATWRNLIGQDIYDTQYVTDVNPTGDFTLTSPISVYFATEAGPATVKGNYSATMILEIYSP